MADSVYDTQIYEPTAEFVAHTYLVLISLIFCIKLNAWRVTEFILNYTQKSRSAK